MATGSTAPSCASPLDGPLIPHPLPPQRLNRRGRNERKRGQNSVPNRLACCSAADAAHKRPLATRQRDLAKSRTLGSGAARRTVEVEHSRW